MADDPPRTWNEDADRPVFRFSTRSSAPIRVVRCLNCDWEAKGNHARTFARADDHTCERRVVE
jgi:hypothetical protein